MKLRGFTVLELVVVLVIIGILAGLGSVAYTNLITKADIEVDVANATAAVREEFASLLVDDGAVSGGDVAAVIAAGEAHGVLVSLAVDGLVPMDGSELAHYVISEPSTGIGESGYLVLPGSTVTEDHVVGYNSTVIHPDPVQSGCSATFTKWAGSGTRLWAVPEGVNPVDFIAANITSPFVNLLWQGSLADHDGNTADGPGAQWGTVNMRFNHGSGAYTHWGWSVANGSTLSWEWDASDGRVYLLDASSVRQGQSQVQVPADTSLYVAFSSKNDASHRYSNPTTISC